MARNEHRTIIDLLRDRNVTVVNGWPMSRAAGSRGGYCRMRIVVDGIDVSEMGGALDLSRQISSYEAIGIYQRSVQAPIQFTPTGSPCGVIMLWSREG